MLVLFIYLFLNFLVAKYCVNNYQTHNFIYISREKMAILQSNQPEIRYLKRQHLEQEAKLISNYYRDLIRMYGIDCSYRKLNTKNFEEVIPLVTENNILRSAYGYEVDPVYSLKADMITYMEIENDIFQLNKYGLIPNMDVTFCFDSNDFACALAEQLGQFKEYQLDNLTISSTIDISTIDNHEPIGLSVDYIDLSATSRFVEDGTDQITGLLVYELSTYTVGDVISNDVLLGKDGSTFNIKFPVNPYIYNSFKHSLTSLSCLDSVLNISYSITPNFTSADISAGLDPVLSSYTFNGLASGTVLFYDLSKIGKYIEKIHPEVGDIVEIDFPDKENKEQYEITESLDKQMTQDGINPLLHKYIWKCKARRYVNTYEIIDTNEANERLEEQSKYDKIVSDEIAAKISLYTDGEDKAYGGYSNTTDSVYDKQAEEAAKQTKFNYIDDGSGLDLITFKCGSKLVTTGYELLFVNIAGDATLITTNSLDTPGPYPAPATENLRYLKATDNEVVFVNIDGVSCRIVEDRTVTKDELEICLNSLFDKTLDVGSGINAEVGDNFYKFKETRTLLIATQMQLFCRLASGKVFVLV